MLSRECESPHNICYDYRHNTDLSNICLASKRLRFPNAVLLSPNTTVGNAGIVVHKLLHSNQVSSLTHRTDKACFSKVLTLIK